MIRDFPKMPREYIIVMNNDGVTIWTKGQSPLTEQYGYVGPIESLSHSAEPECSVTGPHAASDCGWFSRQSDRARRAEAELPDWLKR